MCVRRAPSPTVISGEGARLSCVVCTAVAVFILVVLVSRACLDQSFTHAYGYVFVRRVCFFCARRARVWLLFIFEDFDWIYIVFNITHFVVQGVMLPLVVGVSPGA